MVEAKNREGKEGVGREEGEGGAQKKVRSLGNELNVFFNYLRWKLF